jgi:hypothetical protein
MSVAVSLTDTALTVAAGAETKCTVRVRNSGQVVDQFAVDLVGDVEGWANVVPSMVNLLPGTHTDVTVTFAPPKDSRVLAGEVPFGVRVASREDPHSTVVQEGVITVEPFVAVGAELIPSKRRGRRRAKYRLAVDNTGNQGAPVEVLGADPDDELAIEIDPPTFVAQPGTATIVKVRTVPHKRFAKGEPKTRPFQLLVLAEGKDPVTADGVMTQEQLLPKWLIPAAIALVALAGVLVAVWFMLLKPSVESIAQDQAKQQASQANNAATRADQAAARANKAADGASGDGAGGGGANGAAATTTAKSGAAGANGGAAAPAGTPVSFRVATQAAPVTDGSYKQFSYVAPDHHTLDIGDLVLQNPRGDTGFLRIILGGKVVLEEGLANFRDLDYHYVTPLHVAKDQPVVVAVDCTTPGAGATQCTPSVSFSGKLGK